MFQCPVCGELLEALTNVHCMSRHKTTRKEVIANHGAPKYVSPKITREIQHWIQQAQIIKHVDFEVAQAAARNQIHRRSR